MKPALLFSGTYSTANQKQFPEGSTPPKAIATSVHGKPNTVCRQPHTTK
ncbi:hypothetical protein Pcar_3172 [Syntrophotalea carbinolica DSM 2380]|uniref:Uncharacterized protein n=1 Tax=Syntrophotalea carbinolica (strain DSM 2380 / NBRC 103641 / GraBd1) TaxID=338963 RepID=Q0C6Z5_SYNC1|nr:hypothetical protein Pcar_3172 [Syntrophotalea carbinolica DSM 2380]